MRAFNRQIPFLYQQVRRVHSRAAVRALLFGRRSLLPPLFAPLPGSAAFSVAASDVPAGAATGAGSSVEEVAGDDEETRFIKGKFGDRDKGPAAAPPHGGGAAAPSADSGDSDSDEALFSDGASDDELDAASIERSYVDAINDVPYTGPVAPVAVLRTGGRTRRRDAMTIGTPDKTAAAIFPLDDSRDATMGDEYARFATVSEAEAATDAVRAVVARRAMRAIYSPNELASVAAAAQLMHSDDLDDVSASGESECAELALSFHMSPQLLAPHPSPPLLFSCMLLRAHCR